MINKWLDKAKENGYSFLLIIEKEGRLSPLYADEEDVAQKFNSFNNVDMYQVTNIFDVDKGEELEKPWNLAGLV